MEKRSIGAQKLEVSAIGLGCWGMSDAYGKADRGESLATINEALDSGLNFFDTADVYGSGHNESMLGETLRGKRARAVIATKFGFRGNEHGQVEVCGRASYVGEACDASLKRLGTNYIDLYYLHRVDKTVAIEETVAAMAGLVKAGKVRQIGLSEVSAETLKRANAVHPVAALQSEYSLVTREVESDVLPTCRDLGVGFVAFSPLGRGLLGGRVRGPQDLQDGDYRKGLPRFAAENLERNLALTDRLGQLARSRNAVPAQIALAWVLQQGRDIVPIPGIKSRWHLRENLKALELKLTPEEMTVMNQLSLNVQGARHNDANRRFFDE